MDEATMERAKAAMISEDEAKEIGRNALHGARVLIDRANATGIEERRDEYQEHAADLMVTADLARTVLVLYADLARLRAEHAAALDAARREGAEGMRERAVRLLDACGGPRSKLTIEDAIHTVNDAALPLDAPGGGS
jgi:hypothetical protein